MIGQVVETFFIADDARSYAAFIVFTLQGVVSRWYFMK